MGAEVDTFNKLITISTGSLQGDFSHSRNFSLTPTKLVGPRRYKTGHLSFELVMRVFFKLFEEEEFISLIQNNNTSNTKCNIYI